MREIILAAAILAAVFSAMPALSADIARNGRSVQVDGFIIDWMGDERRPWEGSGGWHWDAVNTPEGAAGYVSSGPVRCPDWFFSIEAGSDPSRRREIRVPGNESSTAGPFTVCSRRVSAGSLSVISVEWLIPWDSAAADSEGVYSVRIRGFSGCGDTLAALEFTGDGKRRGRSPQAPGLIAWLILALAAGAAFAAGVMKIRSVCCRKRTGRREDLRL